MAYTKQTWANSAAGGTPLTAARLQHMEDGIEAAAAFAKSAGTLDATTVNLVGGIASNAIAGGDANTIGGGGNSANTNRMTEADSFRTIAGGYDNLIEGSIASTVSGGAHHRVLTASSHGTVGGGSYNDIEAGDYGTIGGGSSNTVDAAGGTVAGGTTNTVSGQASTIGGGNGNTIAAAAMWGAIGGGINNQITAGNNGAICGGSGNTVSGGSSVTAGTNNVVSGSNSAALGFANTVAGNYSATTGRNNSAAADYSTVSGYQATSRCIGGDYLASGRIATGGDAQSFVVNVKGQTASGTAAYLTLANTSQFITGPDAGAQKFTAEIVAYEPATGASKSFTVKGLAKRVAGATSLVGALSVVTDHEGAGAAAWVATCNISAGTAGIRVQVTGEAAKTINWSARVTSVEVSG